MEIFYRDFCQNKSRCLSLFPLLLWILECGFLKAQTFTDVALDMGVVHTTGSMDGSGNSVSFFDFDNDGWDDLTFAAENDSLYLFRNMGGIAFERLSTGIYQEGMTKHVLWVDYDNDGDYDLFISTYQGFYRLFNNVGNLNFVDVTFDVGLGGFMGSNFGVSFGDVNRDGHLDIYLSKFSEENTLYLNRGDGNFSNMTLFTGLGNGFQLSYQGVWIDYNHDLWPDLLVINDKVGANSLYNNRGNLILFDIAESAGIADPGQEPMTATVGDFDNDGDLDFYYSNTGNGMKSHMYVYQGDSTFVNRAEALGLDLDELAWGASWVDVNNDTYKDLYVTTVNSGALNFDPLRNYFYMNQAGQNFVDSPEMFLSPHAGISYNVAIGDIDNDGYPDIAVQNEQINCYLWHNSGGNNNYAKITLKGTVSNRMAIGAWINVYAAGNRYVHYTQCGENYLSQNSQHHLFGLAQHSLIDSIIIEYPSSIVDKYFNLEVNQSYLFVEGETYPLTVEPSGLISICFGDTLILDAGEHESYLWNNGHEGRYLEVSQTGIFTVTVTSALGAAVTSDSIFVTVNPLPDPSIITQGVSCNQAADGEVLFVSNSNFMLDTLLIDGLVHSNPAQGLQAGAYTFTYKENNGCESEGFFFIDEPDLLVVLHQTSPATEIEGGSINSFIQGGTPPFQIFMNGVLTLLPITNLIPGQYEVLTVDANGCQDTQMVSIGGFVSVHDGLSHTLFVFPNPFNNELIVKAQKRITNVKIFSITGQKVYEGLPIDGRINFEKPLLNGAYMMEIKTENGSITRKMVMKSN